MGLENSIEQIQEMVMVLPPECKPAQLPIKRLIDTVIAYQETVNELREEMIGAQKQLTDYSKMLNMIFNKYPEARKLVGSTPKNGSGIIV